MDAAYCANMTVIEIRNLMSSGIYIDRNKVQKETKYASSKHTVEQSGKGECLDCEKMH